MEATLALLMRTVSPIVIVVALAEALLVLLTRLILPSVKAMALAEVAGETEH